MHRRMNVNSNWILHISLWVLILFFCFFFFCFVFCFILCYILIAMSTRYTRIVQPLATDYFSNNNFMGMWSVNATYKQNFFVCIVNVQSTFKKIEKKKIIQYFVFIFFFFIFPAAFFFIILLLHFLSIRSFL